MRRFLTSCGLPLAALSTTALLAGCSQAAKPDPYKIGVMPAAETVAQGKTVGHWVKKADGSVHFTGTVAPGSAAELVAALTPQTKTVVATVTGGDLTEGLAIGRTLLDRKLGLAIEGACAGPCADYWFPAATARRTATSGSWLGYVPDLSETQGGTPENRAAEAKLYTDAGLDAAKFHAALDTELRDNNPGTAAKQVQLWMPDKADLVAMGYPSATLGAVWLPPNLASANAQAHAWGQIVAYKNTLVGLPPVPTTTAPPPPPPTASGSAGKH